MHAGGSMLFPVIEQHTDAVVNLFINMNIEVFGRNLQEGENPKVTPAICHVQRVCEHRGSKHTEAPTCAWIWKEQTLCELCT